MDDLSGWKPGSRSRCQPSRTEAQPVTVWSVPAVHGPADGERDASGHITCRVTGFVLTGDDIPTTYISGDNASLRVVADVAARFGPIDVAVLFMGGARVPARQRGRPLTLTSAQAAAAAEVLKSPVVIAAHTDGWAHFVEGRADVELAFDDAGIADVLHMPPLGHWAFPSR